MIPIGHATPEEMARIAALEERLRTKTISRDEQLELALLYLEPGHDGFRAAELLQGILATYSEDNLARIWLAFCFVYEWMDEEALRNAVQLGDAASDERAPARLRAAALLLKAAALRQLRRHDDAFATLRKSVELAPDWISNRVLLAQIYGERGDRKAAEDQLRRSLDLGLTRPQTSTYADQLFEFLITGRGGELVADGLKDQLRELTEGCH